MMFTVILGLSALAIPILIHLINPGKGQRLLVGSVFLLKKIAPVKAKEWRLSQWLLLLVRLAIVTVLALLLNQEWLQSKVQSLSTKLVWTSSQWTQHAGDTENAILRSYLEQGYTHKSIGKNWREFIAMNIANSEAKQILLTTRNLAGMPKIPFASANNLTIEWMDVPASSRGSLNLHVVHSQEQAEAADRLVSKLNQYTNYFDISANAVARLSSSLCDFVREKSDDTVRYIVLGARSACDRQNKPSTNIVWQAPDQTFESPQSVLNVIAALVEMDTNSDNSYSGVVNFQQHKQTLVVPDHTPSKNPPPLAYLLLILLALWGVERWMSEIRKGQAHE